MTFYSAQINGIHMLRTYRMALAQMHCVQPPEPKSNTVDLPGADGSLDLSEVPVGYPVYQNREITMQFGTGRAKDEWPKFYSEIQKQFHGKIVKVIFDDDENYYYTGRAAVSDYERSRTLGTLTITVDAEPYKYEHDDGTGDWLWDPFSFVDGIIREYSDIVISGTGNITVIGGDKHSIPEIIASTPMTLTCEGKSFDLAAGHTKLYELPLGEGEHILKFTGSGTVSVRYRGGIL
ncbi:MAG: hypothetical protein Q4C60_07800 [Eubacteriales bacterium]|nr:hypothetical protein [Eubacteriales bacterium]